MNVNYLQVKNFRNIEKCELTPCNSVNIIYGQNAQGKTNILEATLLAMRRAVEALSVPADFALIDGNCSRGFEIPTETVVKGDAKSASIAAASILAKTARDADCMRMDALYPGYGFAKHKGYPTPSHLAALDKLGPCPEHRRSFGPVAQMRLF